MAFLIRFCVCQNIHWYRESTALVVGCSRGTVEIVTKQVPWPSWRLCSWPAQASGGSAGFLLGRQVIESKGEV